MHARLAGSALVAVVVLGACARQDTMAPRLAVASDGAAIDLVQRFFEAYVKVDTAQAAPLLCESNDETRKRDALFIERSQAAGSPYRVSAFDVRRAEPTWVGSEPYFNVEVEFPARDGTGKVLHRYAVRAREGCIELFGRAGPRIDDAAGAPTPAVPVPAVRAEEQPIEL